MINNQLTTKTIFKSAIVLISIVIALTLINVCPVSAAINQSISFRGKITDTGGTAVSDNTYDLTFGLYTAATGGSAIWSEDLTAANRFSATISGSSAGTGVITYTYTGDSNEDTLMVGQYLTNADNSEASLIVAYDTTADTVTVTNEYTAWASSANINNRSRVEGSILDEPLGSVTSLSGINFNQPLYLEVTFNSETMRPRKLIAAVAQAMNADKLDNYDSSEFAVTSDNRFVTGYWEISNIFSISTSSATSTALTVTQSDTGDIVNIFDGGTEVFTILDGGNVGISTTTPWGLFSINPDDITGPQFVIGSSTGVNLILDQNGYLGLGTTSPSFKLSVSGAIYSDTGFRLPDGTLIDDSGDLGKWTTSGSDIYYSTGSVGVGTTTPMSTFAVSGTATLGTTTMQVWNKVVSVDGDHYSQDSIGIQEAINSLPDEGGKVFLPEGTYQIYSAITIPDNVWLQGAGASSTILYLANNANDNVIENADTTNGNSHIKISDLKIDGNDANNTGTCNGIYFSKVTYSIIEDNYIYDVEDQGIYIYNSSGTNNYNKVLNNYVIGIANYNIYFYNSNYNIVSGNYIEGDDSGRGIVLDYSDHSVVSNNIVRNKQSFGIEFYYADYCVAANNRIEDIQGIGLRMGVGNENTFDSNIITNAGTQSIYADYGGGNSIIGNVVRNGGREGIYLANGTNHNVISGNVLYDAAGGAYDNINLNDADYNLISNNRIYDSAGTGQAIDIDASSDYNTLVGNYYSGTGAESINDLSATTIYNSQLYGSDLILKPSGNIGLATTTPMSKLSVTTTGNQLTLAYDGDNYTNITTNSAGNLILSPSGGYVGIGTTTPQTALHIGSASTTSLTTFGDSLFVSGELEVLGSAYLGAMDFAADSGIISWVDMDITSSPTAGTQESYTAYIDGTGILTIYAEADGSGGIQNYGAGIATTSPWALFSVDALADRPSFVIGSSTGVSLILDQNGYLGIGTTTPTQKLSTDGLMYIGGTGTSTIENNLEVLGQIKIGAGSIYIDSTGIKNATGESFVLQPTGGNVGIGTTTPWALLSVNADDISGPQFAIGSSTATNFMVDENGYVGIGTSTPTYALDVYGDVRIDSNLAVMGGTVNNNYGIDILVSDNQRGINQNIIASANGVNGFGIFNTITVSGGSAIGFGSYNNITVSGLASFGYSSYNAVTVSNTGVGAGTSNVILVDGEESAGFGTLNMVGTASGATTESVAGTVTYLLTHSGASDTAFGYYVEDDSGSTGGTQYGLYVDLDDPDVTNYSIYVEEGSGISYLGSNTGIGTSTPWGLLSVNANDISGPQFAVGSSTGTNLIVDENGYVGIGTASPSVPLAVSTGASGAATFVSSLSGGTSDILTLFKQSSDGAARLVLKVGTGGGTEYGSVMANSDGLYIDSEAATPIYLRPNSSTAMTLASSGNVGIGTTTPYAKLSVVDDSAALTDDIFVVSTSTEGSIFKVDGYGNIYYDGTASSPAADYAEYYYTTDIDLISGETVCVDIERENSVKRCDRARDANVMGIVSTKPAIIGNNKPGFRDNPNYAIVGMLGQVPAKVSAENGDIRPGDSLTPASVPGVLMRAGAGDPTVGVALEKHENTKTQKQNTNDSGYTTGIINVLISRRNKSLTVEQVEEQITDRIAAMEIEDEVNLLISSAVNNLELDDEINELVDPKLLLLTAKITVAEDSLTNQMVAINDQLLVIGYELMEQANRLAMIEDQISNFQFSIFKQLSNSKFQIGEEGKIVFTDSLENDGSPLVEIVTAPEVNQTAFVIDQQGQADIAQFKANGIDIVKIANNGQVSIIGELRVDGSVLACAGSSCGEQLEGRLDQTMGDIGAEGKVVAGAFESYCPDGFVWAPGSAKHGTLPGFCFMARSARHDTNFNESETNLTNIVNEDNPVWVDVSQGEAALACQGLGDNLSADKAGYHLISENEWLTLAENILRVASNFSNDGSNNSNKLESNDLGGFTLTNGNVVYDLIGDIAEWTNRVITRAELVLPVSDAWLEYYEVEDYKGFDIAPPYYLTDEDNSVGLILTGNNENNRRGFVRGFGGIYGLDLSMSPMEKSADIGFRCAR